MINIDFYRGEHMPDKWRENIVVQMYRNGITRTKLSELTGYNKNYVSMVLNGSRNSPKARSNIEKALSECTNDDGGIVDELPGSDKKEICEELLKRQLQLLSARSQHCDSCDDLAPLTRAMLGIVAILTMLRHEELLL